MLSSLNRKALINALLATLMLIALVVAGSRNLQHFDAALIAYLFGTVFAFFGIVYRYSVWLQRPPTRIYWIRTWQFVFSRRFFPHLIMFVKNFVRNIVFQRLIYPRGGKRWIGHFLMATGCMIAFMVTIPLTFGWIHFKLKPGTTDMYVAQVFGFESFSFQLGSFIAFNVFHILNWCSWLVIIGVVIFMFRRLKNQGQVATQSMEGDWIPLFLLIAISVTGLGLTYDYEFMQGKTFAFMSVTHAIFVILFLIYIPFGKFFHIIQRPAQLGVFIYQEEGKRSGMAQCPHTGKEFASNLQVNDLKTVTKQLGFDFTLQDGSSHLDYSPEGKRSALAKAHMEARKESGHYFG